MAKMPIGYVPDLGTLRPLGGGTASIGGSSNIGTSGPFTRGHAQDQRLGRPQPAARQYGGGAGNQSRDAFARAAAQQAGNAYQSQMGEINRDFQRSAEQARSSDIMAQRQDAARRFGLDESFKADRRGIALSRREDLRNIRNRLDEHKRNTDLEYTHGMANLVAGGGMLSAMGNAWTQYNQGQPGVAGAAGRTGGGFNPFATAGGATGGVLGGMIGGPGGAVIGANVGNASGRLLSGLFA